MSAEYRDRVIYRSRKLHTHHDPLNAATLLVARIVGCSSVVARAIRIQRSVREWDRAAG